MSAQKLSVLSDIHGNAGFADIGGKITETTTAVTTLSTTLIPVMNTQVALLTFIQSGIERVISAIIGLGFLGALIPHQAGIDYVPRDNYPAMLHRGEAVVRSRENRGGNVNVTVNATVNNASNARQFVDELKKEIKWGSLGNTIENRVRKIA